MTFQAFTRNYGDNSTEAGFQFTFFCDLCGDGYKTKFIEAKSYKKAGLFSKIGRVASIGAQVAGKGTAGWVAREGTGIISERFQGMSPAWQKEHEAAFQTAQNEAKGHFSRCPRCKRYVCENDWNEEEGLCVDDAPREAVEVAAAKGRKMVADIEAKAAQTQVFTGEIETKQTICPQCGKPAGQGKFCNNCGAPLAVTKCPRCGAPNPAGTRFCGECGTKLK
nr:zinc ribbon domain-containing protein [Candidatus Njordarchaeota archaeon]